MLFNNAPSPAGKERQVISSNHDTYLISAESAEDANNWVAAIKRVMHEVCVCTCMCMQIYCTYVHVHVCDTLSPLTHPFVHVLVLFCRKVEAEL